VNAYNISTQLLKAESPDSGAVDLAVQLLNRGELVAIPTETVYGLAANGLDPKAVEKIYEAKGRPKDNPFILHIAEMRELAPLVRFIPKEALVLARHYWPGPLTMILKRSSIVPSIVSAGLDTVAVRMPAHPIARAIIQRCGFPLAAPSANLSGSPSPTKASHVWADMEGRIPLIVDGGDCAVGLESTVVALTGKVPRLLRPGGVTPEELEKVLGRIEIDEAVLSSVDQEGPVASPGMKYKHYAPKAEVVLYEGSSAAYAKYVNGQEGAYALCFEEDLPLLTGPYICYGPANQPEMQAKKIFAALRELDERRAEKVIAHSPAQTGMGMELSVFDRLLRSAGFRIITEP